MKLSKKMKRRIKSRILLLLCITATVLAMLAVGKHTKEISSISSYSATNYALNGTRLENTDTITYIYDANDLVEFSDDVNNGNNYAEKTVYVMDDIDMSTVCSETLGSFTPIGLTGTDFAGTFDGKYHKISNLYIHRDTHVYIGLFRKIASTGTVKNMILENVDILNSYDVIDGYNYVGGIAGICYGTVQNCGIDSGNIANIKKKVYTGSSIYPACYAGGIAGRIDRKHKKLL